MLIEAAKASGSQRYIIRRLECGDKYPLTAAVEAKTGRRCLMIQLDPLSIEHIRSTVKVKGLNLSMHSDKFGTHLQIRAAEQRFEEVFLWFANDIVSTVENANGRSIKDLIMMRLSRWREFFQNGGETGLSREAQIGLFGELYFMKTMISNGLQLESMLSGWCGPDGYPHDYKLGSLDIEIKTSAAKNGRIPISNEFQLDDSNGRLYLAYLEADVRTQGEITLPSLVEEIRRLFETINSADLFDDKLVSAGYYEKQKSLYENTYYKCSEFLCFEVGQGFPRITPAMIPAGVDSVKYHIQLSACTNWQLEFAQITKSLKGGI